MEINNYFLYSFEQTYSIYKTKKPHKKMEAHAPIFSVFPPIFLFNFPSIKLLNSISQFFNRPGF